MADHSQLTIDSNEVLTFGESSRKFAIMAAVVGIVLLGLGFAVAMMAGPGDHGHEKDHAAIIQPDALPAPADPATQPAATQAAEAKAAVDAHADHDHKDHAHHDHDDHADEDHKDHDHALAGAQHGDGKDHGHKAKEGHHGPKQSGLKNFMFAYLVAFCMILGFPLGALFIIMVTYLAKGAWIVTSRRILENMARTMPLMAILSIPIVIAMWNGVLYEHWYDAEHHDAIVAGKAIWLNPGFFTLRVIIYFAVWIILAATFTNASLEQDKTKAVSITEKLQAFSPIGLILFALTSTFAAFDFIMSLDPHWFSTMFGIYYFSGIAISAFAFTIIAAYSFQRMGKIQTSITTEHYHDLGKFMFAFIVFWAYVAFSQYMLIWYADLAEETMWFVKRGVSTMDNWETTAGKFLPMFKIGQSWTYVSIALLVAHFAIPFLGLMSREIKRRKQILVFWSVYMLIMHWVDMNWLIMPELERQMTAMDWVATALVSLGMLAIFKSAFLFVTGSDKNLVPVGDPRLGECLAFENL